MLEYDADTDALYVRLAEGKPDHGRPLTNLTILDCDADGEVLGVELLWVSEGVDLAGVPRAEEIVSALDRLPRSQPAA